MVDIIVIRHGQSEADILNVMEGQADFNLTTLGLNQATLMADWVNKYIEINKIISSPLKRAKQTAEKLSAATNIPVELDDCLMEWKNGLLAGLTREEADCKYPKSDKTFPHTAIYEQESMIDFRARAETALSKIINENLPDSKIAVVSHGGMINMLFRSFIESRANADISISSGDTGIHHWRIEENSRRVVFVNSQIHLLQM